MNEKYYSVSINKKVRTKKEITIDECKKRGFNIKESRLHGDYDVFLNGRICAILFSNKKDATSYVFNK